MKHTSLVAAAALLALLGANSGCAKESAASGAVGTRLALTQPGNQHMAQGESNRIAITIERTGFADPVKVNFSNLPAGVSVADDTIPAGESKKDFVLLASPTAAVVEKQIVTVTAAGRGIKTPQTFELTVKAKT